MLHLLIFTFGALIDRGYAFLPTWQAQAPLPELNRFTQGIKEVLNVRLTVGDTQQRFVIDGFQFQLCKDDPNHQSPVKLPGTGGPRPHLSSGSKSINTLQHGSFINLDGLQIVDLQHGVWEMLWRDQSLAGIVVAGFNLEKDAHRSGCVLDKGNIYMTFPVWKTEGLKQMQISKSAVQTAYDKHQIEKDSQIELMNNSNNLLMKALYYRNACLAKEKMQRTELENMSYIPAQDDMMEIGEDLQLVKTGTLWTTNENGSQKLLGSANIL
jgi:hypothetical protein